MVPCSHSHMEQYIYSSYEFDPYVEMCVFNVADDLALECLQPNASSRPLTIFLSSQCRTECSTMPLMQANRYAEAVKSEEEHSSCLKGLRCNASSSGTSKWSYKRSCIKNDRKMAYVRLTSPSVGRISPHLTLKEL